MHYRRPLKRRNRYKKKKPGRHNIYKSEKKTWRLWCFCIICTRWRRPAALWACMPDAREKRNLLGSWMLLYNLHCTHRAIILLTICNMYSMYTDSFSSIGIYFLEGAFKEKSMGKNNLGENLNTFWIHHILLMKF